RDFHVTGVQTCALPIYLLSFSYFGTHAGRRKYGGHAVSGRHAARSERTLRNEFNLQFAAEQLPFEFGVFAYIRSHHLLYLPLFQHKADAKVVDSGIIGDTRQVSHAHCNEFIDAVFGDATQTETTEHQGGTIENVGYSFPCVFYYFSNHGYTFIIGIWL